MDKISEDTAARTVTPAAEHTAASAFMVHGRVVTPTWMMPLKTVAYFNVSSMLLLNALAAEI